MESQLHNLQGLHHDLLQSYNQQAEEVSRLKQRIQELTSEIDKLRNDAGSNSLSLDLPATFDMIPYPSMPYTYNNNNSGPESCLGRNTVKINAHADF